MTSFNLSEIEQQVNEINKKDNFKVSFSGKALKLDKEEDATEVINEILQCEKLEYLDLAGNTMGPNAAKAISTALSAKAEPLKRAIWKDMFTGRMKDEIPLALEYLGQGLCTANTRLVELDLSDNAFGPIGVKGLASLLTSSSCYTLEELRLNNNGLGISGGKMLARALMDCNTKSLKETNKPLALKVFIAGRNRLENEGAVALAKVFETLKTLEEVQMPQNGIYHIGVESLATALSSNPALRILNLNDNTVGVKGANALAKVLPNFSNLELLNLGDCLLKTEGALAITQALSTKGSHLALSELHLGFNEIRKYAISSIIKAVEDKSLLKLLSLDGNYFGSEGCKELRSELTKCEKLEFLSSMEEDTSDEDEITDEERRLGLEYGTSDEEVYEYESFEESLQNCSTVTADDFLNNPTGQNLLLLQSDRSQNLLNFIKTSSKKNASKYHEELTKAIMKTSALCGSSFWDVKNEAETVTNLLYRELFKYAEENKETSAVNNTLLINLGLIKAEDKSLYKIDWNLEYCFKALEKVTQENYFPAETKKMLTLFIEKPCRPSRIKDGDSLKNAKNSLKTILNKDKAA